MNDVNELEALHSSLLTTELTEAETQALANQMGVTTLRDGEVLVAEGDQCRTLFLLAAGAIQFYANPAGIEEILHQWASANALGPVTSSTIQRTRSGCARSATALS